MCHKCHKWIFTVPIRCWISAERRFAWFHERCRPERDRSKVYGYG